MCTRLAQLAILFLHLFWKSISRDKYFYRLDALPVTQALKETPSTDPNHGKINRPDLERIKERGTDPFTSAVQLSLNLT